VGNCVPNHAAFASAPSTRFNPRLRTSLRQSVSAVALLVAGASVPARAGSAYPSLNQALSNANHTAAATAPANGVIAGQQAQLGAQNMARALMKMKNIEQALQQAEKTGASRSPIIVDGMGAGAGLQVAPAATAQNSPLWQGASLPVQTTTAAGKTVVVQQTQQLAQLTWQSFNVGAKTTLDFNQSAGGTLASSWVVINTVLDPSANPAEILGSIIATASVTVGKTTTNYAPGKVYILDRNGVAFGAGSTVDVGSLIAATANIASTQFATSASGQTSFNLYGAQAAGTDPNTGLVTAYQPSFVDGSQSGAITVARGASIQTAQATGVNSGGYVMLLGGNVANAGLILTPDGQTVMAAGTVFTLRQGAGSATLGSTTLGSEVASSNPSSNGLYTTGSVINTGAVIATTGDISLVGHALTQDGVLYSTTTVDTRGTIHFLTPTDGSDPTASITFAPDSLTAILPDDNGLTALDGQRAANIAASAAENANRERPILKLNNTNSLPDVVGESRVEVSTGGSVSVAGGALVDVPGGQIAVGGGSQVLLQKGATLDVSGTTNALLPASMNDLLVNVQPFQLRDSGANRTGGLKGTNVYIDARTLVEIASGAYSGNIYTAGGLVEVSGYLGLVPHRITEWTALGGQVTLQAQAQQENSAATIPGSVIAEPGSVINLQGGSVTYQAGPVPQTYVETTTGEIFNINQAPGNLVYAGIYNGTTFTQPRWKTSETYVNPLITPATIVDPTYTVGRDAGTLTVNAGTVLLQGAIPAGTILGPYQDGPRPAGVTDPYLLAQTVVSLPGTLDIGNYVTGILQNTALPLGVTFQSTQASGVSSAGTLPAAIEGTAVFDAPALTADGFASIAVSTSGSILVASPLAVANGGTVSLTGADVIIESSITAHGGGIVLSDQLLGLPVAKQTALTLRSGAKLDATGVWTNAELDPFHLAGLGFANGGSVTLAFSQGIDLQRGSTIDVSSGGGLLPGGKPQGASGGSVSISADLVQATSTTSTQAVTLDATLDAYGTKGGGTLSLTAPDFQFGATPAGAIAPPPITVALSSALLSTGFSKYVVDGFDSLNVEPLTQVTATEPVYVLGNGVGLPTGGDPKLAYTLILPPLYTPTKNADTLAERAGASITLLSSIPPVSGEPAPGGGTLSVGDRAHISVDPGQTISLAAFGQISVFGTLTAHGGTISVANTAYNQLQAQVAVPGPSNYQPGESVWIGDGALLDVSGEAVISTDALGRHFGIAPSGGTISLGAYPGQDPTFSTWAQVIVEAGATLDARGAAAAVDVVPGLLTGSLIPQTTPVTLQGNGGSIVARSITGIALDGTLEAQGGGHLAAGGSLTLELDPETYNAYLLPLYVNQPREILVTQNKVLTETDPTLQPGEVAPADTFGLARISEQQISQGGFANLTLSAQIDAIVFGGDVSLQARQKIVLASGVIGDTINGATVRISAPYVDFRGFSETGVLEKQQITSVNPAAPSLASDALLLVNANLIDFSDQVFLGGSGYAELVSQSSSGTAVSAKPVAATAYGFGQADFVSTGDIRFLGSSITNAQAAQNGVAALHEVLSIGDLSFQAGQLYPATASVTQVIAGYNAKATNGQQSAGGVITIEREPGAAPASPYSVGGSLTLIASTINQDGILRAPEGSLSLTDGSSDSGGKVYPTSVTFGPGSITSVSLFGQSVPYGGTVDGVTYLAPEGTAAAIFQPTITVTTQSVDVQSGAIIDLRGGGTLTGAAFVFGRGGSADVLTTPLLDISGGTAIANALAEVTAIQPVNTGDPVYAILPGYRSAYAPAPQAGATTYAAPGIGEQITLTASLPGLPAGTYTLLPANYALLPGGYRVELTSGAVPPGSITQAGNFTDIAAVTLGFAHTGIASASPVVALFTSGSNVGNLSQYDQESYNAFETASATEFGAPRPDLPQDAKTLLLSYPNAVGTLTALSFAAGTLLDAPEKSTGGYGATVEVSSPNPLTIVGPGDQVATGTLAISAASLDGLDIPRLVLGGTLTSGGAGTNLIDLTATAPDVTIGPHAALSAGEVLLTALPGGAITVQAGGTISTIGAGPGGADVTDGYYISPQVDSATGDLPAALDVSNGQVVFVPPTIGSNASAITIASGSTVLAGGSLDIQAPSTTTVSIGDARLGGKYVNISVSTVNIIGPNATAAQVAALPPGLDFAQNPATGENALSALLNGDPQAGIPVTLDLTLTASQEVNITGSLQLNTGKTSVVLNTPAIYGQGVSTDSAALTVQSFTWNGISALLPISSSGSATVPISAIPGGEVGGGSGTLQITAGTITLGYGPQMQPTPGLELDRLIAGFDNVVLTGTREVTANNQNGLSVFATETVFGQPGTGGNLSILSPLITTGSASTMVLTAGGAITLAAPAGASPAATGTVAALGGQIDLTANAVAIATSVALPSGQMQVVAQGGIDIAPGANLDLSGRTIHLFDQTVYSAGGTLSLESAAGDIMLSAGSTLNVSATGTAAGSISLNALAGDALIEGTLLGAAPTGETGGSFTVIAGTLSAPKSGTGSLSAFDVINSTLNAGGFSGSRSFEFSLLSIAGGGSTTDLMIDNNSSGGAYLAASVISVTNDAAGGSIDVTGTIDASGTGPGTIALSSKGNLSIGPNAVLDAHATHTATDSAGQPIDSENRAKVTLTTSAGVLTLDGGRIDVGYPGNEAGPGAPATVDPQGQVIFDAPRNGAGSVAIQGVAPVTIDGAQSVALYAWRTYLDTNSIGAISQNDFGSSEYPGLVTLSQIDADNAAFMMAAAANTGLKVQLQQAGLVSYGASFHLRPGVEIDSTAASGGMLTITGDLDFSKLRYSDVGYGLQTSAAIGSGEPGAIIFRASDQLVVNGSVSDGFATPPGGTASTYLRAETGWSIASPGSSPAADPLNADILLPSSITVTATNGTTLLHHIELGAGTTFDTTRPISLNYAIVVDPANVNANVVIPFAGQLAQDLVIPQGGFVTTAVIVTPTRTIPAGTFLQAGTTIPSGSSFAAGTVFPVVTMIGNNNLATPSLFVPAYTSFQIFYDPTLTLAVNTGAAGYYPAADTYLPDNAFLPSNTVPIFVTTQGRTIGRLELRPTRTTPGGQNIQGLIYPLAALLPTPTQSWNMDFVAGANLASANVNAVLPKSVLNGGALAPAANTPYEAPGSLVLDDQHDMTASSSDSSVIPAFSVIRTGTGDLTLYAGGNFDQSSLYGIYTAGAQDLLPGDKGANAPYDTPRQGLNGDGQIGQGSLTTPTNIIARRDYQAYYPTGGGDLTLLAQGSVTGDVYGGNTSGNNFLLPSDAIGNWLWRQGSTQIGQLTAWWINFGTLAVAYTPGDTALTPNSVGIGYSLPQLVGFQGIGTLGGGNVIVSAGTNAGQLTDRSGVNNNNELRGEGLVIAVASTGRELTDGSFVTTGGGNLTLHVGGTINPLASAAYYNGSSSPYLNGDVIDLRGNITITAGAIGQVTAQYGLAALNDPRPADPFTPLYQGVDGIDLVPGDGSVSVTTLGDLVINGVGDAGRVTEQNLTRVTKRQTGGLVTQGGASGFTLWTSNTSVHLFSDGGNVTPVIEPINPFDATNNYYNADAFDGRISYPSQLYVTAATGDIVYGLVGNIPPNQVSLEVMPSPNEQVALLAGGSIQANDLAIDLSGADPQGLATPSRPNFSTDLANVSAGVTNIRTGGGTAPTVQSLFSQEADTPTVAYLTTQAAATPALFYAAGGDIVNFITGETLTFSSTANEPIPTWYLAAKSVRIEASGDIVSSGTRPADAPGATQQNQQGDTAPNSGSVSASGNLFYNPTAQSVSVVSAGQDIFSSYFYVGGPGLLEMDAGRNISQIGYSIGSTPVLQYGAIKSLGSLETGAPISLSGGAGISVLAGIGTGADYTAFADLYLNPANQANLTLASGDPANDGKVQLVYTSALLSWLKQNYGYKGSEADALTYFLNPANVPVASQDAFLRGVFYDELLASGLEYTDPTSRFYQSYIRGKQAIDALFPPVAGTGAQKLSGTPQGYDGAITMASGIVASAGNATIDAGVATEHGGNIQVLDPGGQITLGTTGGTAPGSSTGFVTNGSGDIDVFSLGSVLLGQSRIFTNAGGNIQIWSAAGNINAGIGARTTVTYDPPLISYDDAGGIVQTPAVPTSGAGIATNNPLPDIPPGNIDLTAPVGTIDAGEAGVRSSGNVNLAARAIANASGITAASGVKGAPTTPTISLGSVEAASGAAGAAASAATQAAAQPRNVEQAPSDIIVEVLTISSSETEQERRRKRGA
jgi:filamentous hemagglutinin family protein